ncbi:flavin reductase family protein [Dactylosporangium sp. CA-139066]|uniref:flavin reductase family protein n=1 Tax=Dactylosporangium sp. CA-139066 TaxID=3239930 RepID=UPI003D9234A2
MTRVLGRPLVHQTEPIEANVLRRVCGLFVTGVAVITSGDGDQATGTTVNSFTSVSLEPPLVLFCLHLNSRLNATLESTGTFGVNLLTGQQEPVAWAFAGRTPAGFTPSYRRCAEGVPVLADAMAYLACRIVNRFPGGDHVIVLGEVLEVGWPRRRDPLIFFQGTFGVLEDEFPPVHPVWDG